MIEMPPAQAVIWTALQLRALRRILTNRDVKEHDHRKLIMQLQPNRPGLGPLWVTRMLSHELAVEAHRDLVDARRDVKRVPVVLAHRSNLASAKP